MVKILPEEFKVFAQYVRALCGLNLDDSKAYLIENRLSSLIQETRSSTFSELYFKAKSDSSQALARKIVDAITTGETLFFRDTAPFELLQHKLLPEIIDRRSRTSLSGLPVPIRIWSAACSTGQEVYSIAIVLKELLGDPGRYNIRLVGTDISNAAIAQASRGVYNQVEIGRGLPLDKLERYFSHQGGTWKVKDEIRALATFRTANLMEDFSNVGRFDVIFCRNVAIYFSEADKISLFNRLARVLEPDGSLVIGVTESITGLCPAYESKRHIRSVYYQLKTG